MKKGIDKKKIAEVNLIIDAISCRKPYYHSPAEILFLIASGVSLSSDICEHFKVSHAHISHRFKALIDAEIINSNVDGNDARLRIYSLTKKGKRLVELFF